VKSFFFFLLSVGLIGADTVVLKNGTRVEGDVISKSEVILKVFSPQFQRSIVIEKKEIDYVEIEGQRVVFDSLFMEKQTYNPKFKVPPKRVRQAIRERPDSIFTQDIFKTLDIRDDSSIAQKKANNLFFNAPARLGSMGLGFVLANGLTWDNGAAFSEYDFGYQGQRFGIKCLNAQIRRNILNYHSTVVIDVGYGKKDMQDDSLGQTVEFGILQYFSARYVYCMNQWLLSPGLSAGFSILKAGVERYGAKNIQHPSASSMTVDRSLYKNMFRPTVGLDLNFYDVVTANLSMDLFTLPHPASYLNLAFLIPFLQ